MAEQDLMTMEQLQGMIATSVAPMAQDLAKLREYVDTTRGPALTPEIVKDGDTATMGKGRALPKQVKDLPWKMMLGGVGGLVVAEAVNLKWPERVLADPAEPTGPTKLNSTNLLVKGGIVAGSVTLGRKYLGKDVATGIAIVVGVSAIATLAQDSLAGMIDTVAGWLGWKAPAQAAVGQGQSFAQVRRETSEVQQLISEGIPDQLARIRG